MPAKVICFLGNLFFLIQCFLVPTKDFKMDTVSLFSNTDPFGIPFPLSLGWTFVATVLPGTGINTKGQSSSLGSPSVGAFGLTLMDFDGLSMEIQIL